MFLFSADSGARPVPSELVLWCVVAFTKERSAWSSRTKMLNQSDWIISNCTSSLLLRELLLVPIGCSTLARLAAVHPSSAQPPPSPSLGPRSSATRSRKGLVFTKFWRFFFFFLLFRRDVLHSGMLMFTSFFAAQRFLRHLCIKAGRFLCIYFSIKFFFFAEMIFLAAHAKKERKETWSWKSDHVNISIGDTLS